MKRIYAPWRSKYIAKEIDPENKDIGKKECVFCYQFEEDKDEKNFILKRYKNCALILNLYPYNVGHCLIIPYAHESELFNLNNEILSEIIEATSNATKVIKKTLKTNGINIGTNLGKASGGSIPEHLHIHILPRWWGDTNFLATLADTKQISSDLVETYKILKRAFEQN